MKSEEDKKSKKSFNIDMKPSFTISPMIKWILTILILGVGVVLVVVFYAREQSRNDDLQDQVSKASTDLVKNSLDRRDAEDRLATASLNLAELAVLFPSAKQSMDVEEALFSAAADSGVAIANISCTDPKAQQISNGSYMAFGATVTVSGDTESCLRFVGRLGYWLPSASIGSVSMDVGGMTITLQVYAGVGE